MYILIGIRIDYTYGYNGWNGDTIRSEEIVATFGTREEAERYAKNSQLKGNRGYKNKSLLFSFDDHEVVHPTEKEIPPHNPVLL
jgi:hypothetical protein